MNKNNYLIKRQILLESGNLDQEVVKHWCEESGRDFDEIMSEIQQGVIGIKEILSFLDSFFGVTLLHDKSGRVIKVF